MANDLNSLLGRPNTSWEQLAQAYMQSRQKNKKRKRRAMLVAMLGNVWEARGLSRIRESVADFEASGAVEKAKELQYATDRAKVLDVQTAIETAGSESVNKEGEKVYTGHYIHFRPEGEAAFEDAHRPTLHLYDTTNPRTPRTNLTAKEDWIKDWIDENPMQQHQKLYNAWEFNKDIGVIANADNKVLTKNIVKPASFKEYDTARAVWVGPNGQTWQNVGGKLRHLPKAVYSGSADELTRLQSKYAARPANSSWIHGLGERMGVGRSYDDTLSKISFEEARQLARQKRYIAAENIVTVNRELSAVSVNDLDAKEMSAEMFDEYARGYLANQPLLIKSAKSDFTQKITDKVNTMGNARAILQAHVDDAEWKEKEIRMTRDIERMERLAKKEEWSPDRISNEREYIMATSLNISTAIIEKRIEITELAKQGLALGLFGDKLDIDDLTKRAWETQLISIFGNSTKQQAYAGVMQATALEYHDEFIKGELESAIFVHLGNLNQKGEDGNYIYRSWDLWEKRGLSFETFKKLEAAELHLADLDPNSAEYKALFKFKTDQHRILSQENSALYAAHMAEMVDAYQKRTLRNP